jgi:hypothetical protein
MRGTPVRMQGDWYFCDESACERSLDHHFDSIFHTGAAKCQALG